MAEAHLDIPAQAEQRWTWWRSLGLRPRILLLLVAASLPGIVVAVFLARAWLQDQTLQIETSVERLASLAAAQHETVIENARVLLGAVAHSQGQAGQTRDDCAAYLTSWLEQFPQYTSLTLYGEGGTGVCATVETELPGQVADAEWFGELRAGKQFVLGRYAIGETGNPLLVAGFALPEQANGFAGAVALGINLWWLDFLGKAVELPEQATITALNEKAELLSHNAARGGEEDTDSALAPSQSALEQMAALGSGTLRAENVQGSPRVYGFQKTKSGEIIVAVGHTPYLGYARYWDALFHTLASPLLVLLLSLLAAGYASEAFVIRFVRSMTRTAEAIREGDLSARTDVPHDSTEIGVLAATLDEMAEAIEKNKDELEELAERKDMLNHELNHRVKNNLQVVLSMLRGVTRESGESGMQDRLRALAGRIQTLAQIHQLLYKSYGNAAPPLASYVRELTRLLAEFYESRVGLVRLESGVGEIDLSIEQCISFGLILNELVANAEEHAFDDSRSGSIDISVTIEEQDGKEHVHLVVSDDGKGIPPDFDVATNSSSGTKIVLALARQLGGEIWAERREKGTAMHLRFKPAGAAAGD